MTADRDLEYLLRRAIPDALDPIVRRAVGTIIPRTGEDGRYRVAHTGQFSSRYAGDLLTFARNQRLDGALVVIEPDVLRAIYFRNGRAVGASSDVLFERLGRILLRGGLVDERAATQLVAREEAAGLASAAAEVTPEAAAWALETRVWDVAAALFLVRAGHFVIVEGTPELGGLPAIELSPSDLALEGLRRYDEWRHGPTHGRAPRSSPASRPPHAPPAAPGVARSSPSGEEAIDELLERLRALG